MGLRETLNKNQGLVVGVVVVLILAAGWVAFTQFRGGGGADIPNASFYTDDNGATFFKDDYMKVPPFDHNGKEAVRAFVYECNGKQFVAYMERYSPEARPLVEKLRVEGKNLDRAQIQKVITATQTGKQRKRPADADWGAAGGIAPQIKCDDGSPATNVKP